MADLVQALPTQFNGLGDLWNYMPAVAAQQTGENMLTARQNNQSLQDAFSAQEAHKAAMRPGELLGQQADTNYKNAHTGLLGAQTNELTLKNDIGNATKDSTISATNAGNKAKESQANVQELESFGERLRAAGAAASAEPFGPNKIARIKSILGKDFDFENPEFQQFLGQHSNNLGQWLTDYGNGVYGASAKAREAALREERELAKEKMRTESAEKIAKMQIEAGRFAPKAGSGGAKSESELVAKMGYEKAAAYFFNEAKKAQQAGDDQTYQLNMAKAQTYALADQRKRMIAALAAQGGKPDLKALGIQTNPDYQLPGLEEVGPGAAPAASTPRPAPQARPAPQGISSLQDLRKAHPEYKDIPDNLLREQYKRHFNMDLK